MYPITLLIQWLLNMLFHQINTSLIKCKICLSISFGSIFTLLFLNIKILLEHYNFNKIETSIKLLKFYGCFYNVKINEIEI